MAIPEHPLPHQLIDPAGDPFGALVKAQLMQSRGKAVQATDAALSRARAQSAAKPVLAAPGSSHKGTGQVSLASLGAGIRPLTAVAAQKAFDAEYDHWRAEQLRKLDSAFPGWRQDSYSEFSGRVAPALATRTDAAQPRQAGVRGATK